MRDVSVILFFGLLSLCGGSTMPPMTGHGADPHAGHPDPTHASDMNMSATHNHSGHTHSNDDGTHSPDHRAHTDGDVHGNHNGDGGDTDGSHSGGGHTMFFNIDQGISVLFEFWTLDSVGATVGTSIGFAFLAALYEGLKWVRERMMRKSIQKAKKEAQLQEALHANLNGNGVEYRRRSAPPPECTTEKDTVIRIAIVDHVLQTMMHMLQVLISYFLMLAFMTYNVWIGLGIIIGAGFGYFVFGAFVSTRTSVSKMSEHCH